MSESSLPDAPDRDWADLLGKVIESERALTREQLSLWEQGLHEGEANAWGRDYVTAMQAALERRDTGRLLRMLDAGLPVPRILLPVLADVVRSVQQGHAGGRASKLTAFDEGNIRFLFDVMTERDRKSPANVRRWLLRSFREKLKDSRLSISTLNRALRRTGRPSPARFVMLPAQPRSSKSPDRMGSSAGREESGVGFDEDPDVQASLDYGSNDAGH